MRSWISWLAIAVFSTAAAAHEGHHHDDAAAASGKLTGEVVDITCYVDHQSHGEKHAACAQKCISAGNPVGIVVAGKLYVVIQDNHESPNAKLAPFAGKLVTLTGKRLEKDGLHVFDLESVAPAAP
jgi:hypothetical protein